MAGLKGAERDAVVLKIEGEERTAEAKIAHASPDSTSPSAPTRASAWAWAPADGGTVGLIHEAYQQALALVVGDIEQCAFTSVPLAAIYV